MKSTEKVTYILPEWQSEAVKRLSVRYNISPSKVVEEVLSAHFERRLVSFNANELFKGGGN